MTSQPQLFKNLFLTITACAICVQGPLLMSGSGLTPILEPIVTRLLGYPPTPAYHKAYSPNPITTVAPLVEVLPPRSFDSIFLRSERLLNQDTDTLSSSFLPLNAYLTRGISSRNKTTRHIHQASKQLPFTHFPPFLFVFSTRHSTCWEVHGQAISHLNSALVLDGR